MVGADPSLQDEKPMGQVCAKQGQSSLYTMLGHPGCKIPCLNAPASSRAVEASSPSVLAVVSSPRPQGCPRVPLCKEPLDGIWTCGLRRLFSACLMESRGDEKEGVRASCLIYTLANLGQVWAWVRLGKEKYYSFFPTDSPFPLPFPSSRVN